MSSPTFSDRPSGTPDFYHSLPGKQVAAGCLFTDESGSVLLVKPAYKEPWEIPGGSVEANESPLAACSREIQEELGIELPVGRLLCVDYRHAVDGVRGDALRFVFFGGVLTAAHTSKFVLRPDELLDWKFVAMDQLDEYVIPVMARRLRSCTVPAGAHFLEEGTDPL